MTYLADAYGKNDTLYPKNPKCRALVDQRLYFDIGTLYARFADYYVSFIFIETIPMPTNLLIISFSIQ